MGVDREAALAVALTATPLLFIWTLELAVRTNEVADTTLTVFIWPINALPMYHAAMYVLLLTTCTTAYYLAARPDR